MQAERVLHDMTKRVCPEMHLRRRDSLIANTMAALKGRGMTVTQLGRTLQSDAQEKHCITRTDRLLSNRHLHDERTGSYAQNASWLVGGQRRPIVVIDGSDLDASKRHFLLRASIPMNGRSLTLYEEVHTAKTNERPGNHRAFLLTLEKIVPRGSRPIVLSDAGLRTRWFAMVEAMGWDWVGRVRNRHWVELNGSGEWFPCKSLYEQATGKPTSLGEAKLTWQHAFSCHLVLYKGQPKGRTHRNRFAGRSESVVSNKHAKAQTQPWLLATLRCDKDSPAKDVVALYRLRMQIEEAFRDLKSSRFGLGLERQLTYQVQRLQVLLLIATLALRVAWILGVAVEHTGQHRQYQANSIKHRVVLSTIFLGLRVIDDHRVTLRPSDLRSARQSLAETAAQHSLA